VEAGVDGLSSKVARGRLQKSSRVATMVLLPLVCSTVGVPVVAAAALWTDEAWPQHSPWGRTVQMGTRMVSAEESPVHANWKASIIDAKETIPFF